ncbi:MAG TPA: DUF4340 domain-containing protein [Anaerolineae bacterium]|nr:DUF4340 domain-containing protein [Anaerolineae bacterium]
MDRRITLILVVILVLLGGYIWFNFMREGAAPTPPETPEPTPLAFLSVPEDKVTNVQVRDVKNNKVTQISRNGDKWNMEQPAQGEAYQQNVDDFLFELANITAERKIDNPSDLAGFGLNPPAYELKVTQQDGQSWTVQLGTQNPDKSYYYALKNGDSSVYLVNTSVGEAIENFVNAPPFTPTPSPTVGESPTPSTTEPPTPSAVPSSAATPTP